MTNADKIKNMTNEELATLLSKDALWRRAFFPRYCGVVAEGENPGFCDDDCYECILNWLNKTEDVAAHNYEELVRELREADKESMCDECGVNLHSGTIKKGALFAEAADAIEELKEELADVRPVVRAHWIETAPINEKTMKPLIVKGPHLKCSNCGIIEFQRNFCPNCGADMEEIIYNEN